MMLKKTNNSMEQPFISIIMNCYNGEKYLRQAIDSVLAQVHENWEIIFWDNQSKDCSAEIFRSYDDPRLKYFLAPTHTLLYEARNFAIDKAEGEFFAFLDVDDWWYPEKLEKQIHLFIKDPEVGIVCSNYWIKKEKKGTCKLFRKRTFPQGWVLNDLLMDYSVGLLTLMVRRTAFNTLNGGCDPRFHIIGDNDLVVRLAMKWKLACCQEPLAYCRIHGENESQKQKARTVAECEIWVKELGKNPDIVILPGYKKIVDELTYLQGRLCIDQNRKGEAVRHIVNLPWGKYKIKLWLSFTIPKALLSLMGY